MGQLKKYEAHTRYPCCCCAVDVKRSVLALSILGLVFCLFVGTAAAFNAFFNSSDSGGSSLQDPYPNHSFATFNILLFYAIGFGSIIFGVATNRPSYLTIFLIVNGFMIVFLSCILVFVFLLLLVSDGAFDNLGYPGIKVQYIQLKHYIISYKFNSTEPLEPLVVVQSEELDEGSPRIIAISDTDVFYYSVIFLLSIVASLWLVIIFAQGLVFHAFRSLRLRKEFEYNPYNARNLTSPITMQHNGANGLCGGFNSGGNNYISSIKRSLFPKRI